MQASQSLLWCELPAMQPRKRRVLHKGARVIVAHAKVGKSAPCFNGSSVFGQAPPNLIGSGIQSVKRLPRLTEQDRAATDRKVVNRRRCDETRIVPWKLRRHLPRQKALTKCGLQEILEIGHKHRTGGQAVSGPPGKAMLNEYAYGKQASLWSALLVQRLLAQTLQAQTPPGLQPTQQSPASSSSSRAASSLPAVRPQRTYLL